jgi:hypothetical protein
MPHKRQDRAVNEAQFGPVSMSALGLKPHTTSLVTWNLWRYDASLTCAVGRRRAPGRWIAAYECVRDVTRAEFGNGLPRRTPPTSHAARHRQRRWRRAPALRGVQQRALHLLLTFPTPLRISSSFLRNDKADTSHATVHVTETTRPWHFDLLILLLVSKLDQ